jgi:Spy/CpxP family protein refolding chaperone
MNRSLKLLAAFSISALVMGAPTFAEEGGAKKEGGARKEAAEGGRKKEGQRPGGPAERLQMLADHLDLTADQKKEAAPIIQETREAVQKIMQDQTVAKEDKRAKVQEAVKSGQEKLAGILTPEQKEKLAKARAEGGPKQGPRDGEGAKKGPRDGEGGAKKGPRDGEGGAKKNGGDAN